MKNTKTKKTRKNHNYVRSNRNPESNTTPSAQEKRESYIPLLSGLLASAAALMMLSFITVSLWLFVISLSAALVFASILFILQIRNRHYWLSVFPALWLLSMIAMLILAQVQAA